MLTLHNETGICIIGLPGCLHLGNWDMANLKEHETITLIQIGINRKCDYKSNGDYMLHISIIINVKMQLL